MNPPFISIIAAIASASFLPGCATILEGSGQSLNVATNPAGASCTLDRMGMRVGTVAPTPGTLRLDKSKNDLTVTCAKEGYATVISAQPAKFGGTTFVNLLVGGIGGFIVDAATGANYTYPTDIMVTMVPAGPKVATVPDVIVLQHATPAS